MKIMQQQTKQQEGKKAQEEYDKKFEEIKSITSKTKQAYVPILCKLVEQGWPELSIDERQEKVIDDCDERLGWNRDTVDKYIPSKFKPQTAQSLGRKKNFYMKIERENAPKIEQALKYFDKITEIPIQIPPEPKTDTEGEGWDLEGGRAVTYGEKEKPYSLMKGAITLRCTQLFEALTECSHLPHNHEDVELDYIKPTRDYRKTIILESDEQDKKTLWNCLGAADAAIQDMLNLLEDEMKK